MTDEPNGRSVSPAEKTGDSSRPPMGQPRRSRKRRRRPTPQQREVTAATGVEAAASGTTASKTRRRPPASGRAAKGKRKPTGRGRSPLRVSRTKQQPSEFGTTWWARRWLSALEKFGWLARLERGRDYARRGNVLDLDISPGRIAAQVQGSRPWPYQVDIRLQPLTDEQWDRVVRRLGKQALYAAKLLAGDMPQNMEDIFNAADVALIPKSPSAFTMSCTCPDTVAPCKHIAAVHYVLGHEFDRDPFVLFELRGRTRQDIVKALQGRPESEVVNSLPLIPPVNGNGEPPSLENFWKSTGDLRNFPIHIGPAPVPGGLLKRLGPLPLRGQSDEWRSQLFDVYRIVSRRSAALGRGDDKQRDEPTPPPLPPPSGDA